MSVRGNGDTIENSVSITDIFVNFRLMSEHFFVFFSRIDRHNTRVERDTEK